MGWGDFDAATFLRQKRYALTHAPSGGAFLLLAAELTVPPLVHLGLALDAWLHPEIADTPVRRPLFVLSSPRSGSTALLNLLDADAANACYHTRELLMPSPTVRRLLPERLMARADAFFQRCFSGLEAIHPLRFEQAEEDELLFLLLGNSGIGAYLFPYEHALEELSRFWQWPAAKRARVGRFYHGCVQRLLWARGASRYISKSPHFLGKVDDLRAWYPDARFISLVRSPYEAVPSYLSMMVAFWRLTSRRVPSQAAIETAYRALLDLAVHGHAALQRQPASDVLTLAYEQLVAEPRATVEAIYAWQGWPITPALGAALGAAGERQRGFRSRHRYTLEQFGLDAARIRRDWAFLFDRHAFERAA
ncbi:MAG: sulfotransferase [Deltaproteobacteria bacterium]|nr:sulfotransferase [Deltaproteobacteria bacterium]